MMLLKLSMTKRLWRTMKTKTCKSCWTGMTKRLLKAEAKVLVKTLLPKAEVVEKEEVLENFAKASPRV